MIGERFRLRTLIALLLVGVVAALAAVLYLRLPDIAPRLLLRWGYEPTGNRAMYSGIKVDDRLGDYDLEYRKHSMLVPGPEILEVLLFKDGEIAMISTPLRKQILFKAPMRSPEEYLEELRSRPK